MLKSIVSSLLLMVCLFRLSHAGELEVRDAWIREAPPAAKSHAAYMELVNNGEKDVIVMSVLAEDYGMAMVHKTLQQNGMATMEHMDTLVIPSHSFLKLEPGGLHLMLMQPKRILKAGDTVKITICFDRDHCQQIAVLVRAVP